MAPHQHARLSPSSASRWMRCPGSVNFLQLLEEDGAEGTYAAEGTILHSFCEDALRSGNDAYRYVGQTRSHFIEKAETGPDGRLISSRDKYSLELDEELADMMQSGLDYIDSMPGKLFIEHKVDLSRWMPGQFGTLDVGICGRKRIIIFDWKWGMVPVSPIRNEQLQIYALGFWDNVARHHTSATDFHLVIWQPRAPGGGGEWDVTLDELLVFGRELTSKARQTYGNESPRIPGPVQCQYCDGARQLKCREYAEYNLSLVVQDFEELDDDARSGVPLKLRSHEITPERRGYILEHRPMIEKFLDRLHAQAVEDALYGRPTPGQKLVYGRNPPRKWRDKLAAEDRLGKLLDADAYLRKLKSPKQIESELPPKIFARVANLIDRGEPKPTLVSADDARPAIPSITDLFDD